MTPPVKKCQVCNITKSLTDFYKNKSRVDGYRYECKECIKVYQKSDMGKAQRHRYATSEKGNAASRRGNKRYNSTENGKKKKAAYAQLPYWVEYRRAYHKLYIKTIPGKIVNLKKRAKYRASLLNAMPPWLSNEHRIQITAFYSEAIYLTHKTGIRHEVDHIIPLQGKNVRGLHVPWNLRVITRKENRRKGNKVLWP